MSFSRNAHVSRAVSPRLAIAAAPPHRLYTGTAFANFPGGLELTTVYDVPAEKLIEIAAKRLEPLAELKPPEWAPFVKTGTHREKPPTRKDWWHVRAAAVLRKVYLHGPIGTERLAAMFGGNRDGGSAPKHPKQGSRNIIRKELQQLKAAGFIADEPKSRGKVITPKGQSFLDNAAYDVWKDLAAKRPDLNKYR